jgi:hypothetical protein
MLITRGLDPTTRLVVDDHGRRLVSDRLTLSGFGEVSPMRVATLRRMLTGLSADHRQAFRITDLAVAMRVHAEALNFTEDCFRVTQRAVTVAAVRAVVARASYSADLARLRVFVQVLTSGIMTERSDSAAIVLRNNLVMTPQHGRGALTQVAIYAKTERALQAFLSRAELSKLYETQRELFPLPEERAVPKRKVKS